MGGYVRNSNKCRYLNAKSSLLGFDFLMRVLFVRFWEIKLVLRICLICDVGFCFYLCEQYFRFIVQFRLREEGA